MNTSANSKAPLVSTQTKDPWAPTQPYLQGMLPATQELFASDTGYKPYSGATTAAMDGRSVDALNSAESIARGGDSLGTNAYNGINQITANQGLNSGLLGSAGTMRGVAQSGGLGTDALYQDVYGRAGQNGDLENFYGGMRQANPFSGIAGGFGGLANQAPGMNQDVMGYASGIGSGANGINTGGQYGALGQQAGSQNALSRGVLGSAATGGMDVGTGQYDSIYNRAGGPSSAETNLAAMASGQEGVDPNLKIMLDDNAARIANQSASKLSGSGRFGSNAAFADMLGRNITAANAPVLFQASESAKQRQMGANSQIDAARQGLYGVQMGATQGATGTLESNMARRAGASTALAGMNQADLGQRLAALQGETGVQGQNIANQLSGAGLLSNLRNQNFTNTMGALPGQQGAIGNDIESQMAAAASQGGLRTANANQMLGAAQGLTTARNAGTQNTINAATQEANIYGQGLNRELSAAGMAPQAYQNLFTPSQMLSGVGDAYRSEDQNQLNDLINYWNASEARPWEQVARANGLFSGLGALGGTQVNTKPDTSPATWQKVLGGAVAGGGLLSKFL